MTKKDMAIAVVGVTEGMVRAMYLVAEEQKRQYDDERFGKALVVFIDSLERSLVKSVRAVYPLDAVGRESANVIRDTLVSGIVALMKQGKK